MKCSKSGFKITIEIDNQEEADILASCLNWGFFAMARSKMIDCQKEDAETLRLGRIETEMWKEYCKVNDYKGGDFTKPLPHK